MNDFCMIMRFIRYGNFYKTDYHLILMYKENCIFCKISKGEVEGGRIYDNDNFFSIYDQNQDIKGHALVISKGHFENTLDLPVSLGSEFFDCVKKTATILLKKHVAGGFNIVNNNFPDAEQVIMHFHVHLLPRKRGDSVKIVG